ncbi:DUF6474 family protein [Actinocrispum sp. NPDC049592]|uniref:DUF6474 family protein n=1 Tax=Actinocrispum sp. NPDC049592 TaxID=3154835 RepID=UPI003414DE30
MARSGKPRITPRNAKNAVAVAKVIGPAIAPIMLPIVAKAAATLRSMKDSRRAHKLGVPLDDLAKYSGKGGHLHARIAGLTDVLTELRAKDKATDTAFIDETQTTLTQLAAAVRAAERMPTPRRKTAHRAVAQELDLLEDRLMHKLGI